jgi:hypothetical protein
MKVDLKRVDMKVERDGILPKRKSKKRKNKLHELIKILVLNVSFMA